MRHLMVVALATFLTSACIFYPKVSDDYSPDCQTTSNMLTLDLQIPDHWDCKKGSVGACLAVITASGPATAVVSGSVVVAGNTLSWLEKKGRCSIEKKFAGKDSKQG